MASLFFRIFRHLLPDAHPWRLRDVSEPWKIGDGHHVGDPGLLIGGKEGGLTLWRFFDGLAQEPGRARAYLDQVYDDQFPETTRLIAEWEKEFGLEPKADELERRLRLAAEWAAGGGQSPRYLQDVVQTAGFPLYIHEWWQPGGPPWVARDPRDHTDQPLIGYWQCSAFPDQPQCSAFPSQPQCNAFLANDPGYIVNKDLTPRAPPPVPDDPAFWPYFLYWGAENFPDRAEVAKSRRTEVERLLLKLCPSQQWLVTLIDYVDDEYV